MADGPPQRLFDPVVIGYDGSDASRRAVARATAAAEPAGRLVLVTAAPPADSPIAGEEVAGAEWPGPEELLDEAFELCSGRDVQVVKRLVHADPVDALTEVARDVGAELIVVGARGESFVARTLRGSVGERLVARAPCDVLVVR